MIIPRKNFLSLAIVDEYGVIGMSYLENPLFWKGQATGYVSSDIFGDH